MTVITLRDRPRAAPPDRPDGPQRSEDRPDGPPELRGPDHQDGTIDGPRLIPLRSGRRQPGETRLPVITKGRIEQLASVPICAFNGYNGTGKSMAAMLCAMAHLDAGRPVLSTVRVQDYRNPRECTDSDCASVRHGEPGHLAAHPLWQPLTDWRQLLGFRGGYILLDETTGVADAREHQSMPAQVGNFLPQLRRRDAFLGWTTIDWRFADARLRRLTFALLWATGMRPEYVDGEMWGRNRAFLWRVYDSRGIGDDFDPSCKRDGVQLLARVVFRRGPSLVTSAYDTLDDVLNFTTNEAGLCVNCLGHRARKKCECVTADQTAGREPLPVPRPRSRRSSRTPDPAVPSC